MHRLALVFTLAAALPLLVAGIAPPAAQASEMSSQSRARVFPWCLRGGAEGGTRCRYTSREQCVKTSRGQGGACIRNPEYTRG